MVFTNVSIGTRELTATATAPDLISENKEGTRSERTRLILVNTSTAGEVWRIGIELEPSTSLGIPLYPGGSITWEKTSESFPIQQKRVQGIATAATATLSIYEEVVQ